MAKTKKIRRGRHGGVNKAQAIRDELKVMGNDASPKEVIARLKKKKIAVSPAQVSNVKASLRKGSNGSSRGRKKASTATVSIAGLFEAKRLIDVAGGVNEARAALDTLAELQ